MEKADCTNLERLKCLAEYASECPEVLADYLSDKGFCCGARIGAEESRDCGGYDKCRKCITEWLNEMADC